MNDPELRVRQAFESLEPAPDLNQRTLAYIASAAPAPAPAKKRRKPLRWAAGLAAAACLVAAAIGIFSAFNQVTAYIDIDINPSIELGVNRFGTVVSAEGVNEDGQTVLTALKAEGITLTGASYEDAAAKLASSSALGGFVTSDSYAQVSIICEDESQAAALEAASRQCFSALPCNTACSRATTEEHQAAQEAGMGVGRYQAACQLMEKDSSYTLEECSHMTMRQLRDALKGNNGATHGNGQHTCN